MLRNYDNDACVPYEIHWNGGFTMKKFLSVLLLAALLLGCLLPVSALGETTIEPDMKMKVSKPANVANNPVIEGENPLTGLPLKDDAGYTPILLVIDNNAAGAPHYGVGSADIMFQIPNMGFGSTKLMALFASEYPTLAGGSRSARMTMLPMANAFNAAFAAAGEAPIETTQVSVTHWLSQWGYYKKGVNKYYNLLGGGDKAERTNTLPSPYNLLGHIAWIHEDLVKRGVEFEVRPFLFTDTPLSKGDAATQIDCQFFGNKDHSGENESSACTFYYDEGVGYTRESAAGIDIDRETKAVLTFANVIVMRVNGGSVDGYTYIKNNMTGGCQADIFQNGHYIKGSWYRDDEYSRLIFLDDEGKELNFQRGKTFILVTNGNTLISYK